MVVSLDKQASPSPLCIFMICIACHYQLSWSGITDNDIERLPNRESREEGKAAGKNIHKDKIRENQRDDASTAGSGHSPGAHMDNRFPLFA